MKKNFFVILVCTVCLIYSELSAKKYYDRGFYGSLSFLYWDENVESSTKYSQNDFLQEYKIGYMGNIYNPRLIDYKLEGIVRFENLLTNNNQNESRTKTESQDYKVNFSFIRGSNFPFNLYASTGKRPITRIDTTGAYTYLYKTNTKGINGSMKFKPFVINYGASSSTNISESNLNDQNIKTDVYYAALKHGEDKYEYSIDYSHLTQKIQNESTSLESNATTTTYLITRNDTDQINDSVDLRYRLNILESLIFNTNLNYYESEFTGIDSKSLGASANLQWRPNDKFTSSVTLNGRTLENTTGENLTKNTSTFDTFSVYESINYRIIPSLNIFQSASDYIYENSSVKGDIKNFRMGANHNYRNEISNTTNFSLYTTVYMQNVTTSSSITQQVDTNDTNITATDVYDSINRYNINIKATLADEMPAINSNLRLRVDLYNMQTSTEEAVSRYSSDLQFMTKFYYIFRNNITFGASQNETTRVRLATTTSEASVETTKTSIINASESLSFTTRLGINGRLGFMAGVKYSSIDYGNVTINRTQPMADIKLNYRLGRNLNYFASLHVDKDLIYDYTNYIGITKLTYKIGRTSFLASYRYNKTEVGANSDRRNYQRSRLDVKLVRAF